MCSNPFQRLNGWCRQRVYIEWEGQQQQICRIHGFEQTLHSFRRVDARMDMDRFRFDIVRAQLLEEIVTESMRCAFPGARTTHEQQRATDRTQSLVCFRHRQVCFQLSCWTVFQFT